MTQLDIISDPAFAHLLTESLDDEDDLVESSDASTENSQLACQIALTPEIYGLTATIAEED